MDTFLIVEPKDDFRLLGTGIELTKGDQYVAIPALNQPDKSQFFILCDPKGGNQVTHDDIEYCIGFLLAPQDIDIIDHDVDYDDLRHAGILIDDIQEY